MMAVFMDAARAAGVDDRVISYHSSLGVLEWPPVVFDGIRYPGVSELAALQSAAFGVPADQHVEVTRTLPGPDGTRIPHSLLTEIAAYGRFPRMGSPYCRKAAKEGVVSSAWTPMVSRRTRELGPPVRILKIMGLRSDEGADRRKRPALRTVQANSARVVDEWLPVKDWTTDAVKEWHTSAPVPYCGTYDSVPGAGDWLGSSQRPAARRTGRGLGRRRRSRPDPRLQQRQQLHQRPRPRPPARPRAARRIRVPPQQRRPAPPTALETHPHRGTRRPPLPDDLTAAPGPHPARVP
jgi:hypothetical protein